MTTNNATTNARRLVEADRELSEHFTAAVGAKAQRYDPSSGSDVSPEEAIMSPSRSRARARFRVVEAMLAAVAHDARRVLSLVYGHRADAMSDATDDDGKPMAGKPSGLITGKNGSPDPFGLLRVALSPTWGHGSFMRIAGGQYRALRAFAKRHPNTPPTGDVVLDFLAFEAGRGDASARMLAELRNECQEARDAALAAFADVRGAHLAEAAKARQEARAAEQRKAEEALAKAREKQARARATRAVPACLRMTDEERERLSRAARAVLDDLARDAEEAIDLEKAS